MLIVVCAACGDDNDDSMTSAAGGPTSGSTTGDATTSTTPDTGGTTGDDPTGGMTDGDTTGESDGTPGADPTGGTTDGDTTGASDGMPCEKASTWQVMCDPESPAKDELVAYCEEMRELVELQGASCAALYDEAQECLAALTCESDSTGCEAKLEAAFVCVEVGEACQAFGAKEAECNPDEPTTAEECQWTLNYSKVELGEACGTAWEQYAACYGQQTCIDLESGACLAEVTAYVEACEE